MTFRIFVAALALVAPATVAATETQVTWHGVTLGAKATSLRPLFGDPLRIVVPPNADRRIARYWLPGADSTYFLAIEEQGYVTGFEAVIESTPADVNSTVPPDPSGVRLGDTLESVKAKHPSFHSETGPDGNPALVGRISGTVGAAYGFENNRVRLFHWVMLVSGPPLSERLSEPSGDSAKTAILDVQQNEADGTSWEYRYLSFQPCDGQALWHLQRQSLVNQGGRAYDILHVVCPTTKSERDFYFDITSYFGKM